MSKSKNVIEYAGNEVGKFILMGETEREMWKSIYVGTEYGSERDIR